MEWIFDHFQLVLGIIIVAGYVIRGILGNRPVEGSEEPDSGSLRESAEVDIDEADRTRRIQEEIRRRILARQRGEEPVQSQQRPAVSLDPVVVLQRTENPPPIRQAAQFAVDPLSEAASRAVLDRQRRLEEQMNALRQARDTASTAIPKRPSRSWEIKPDRTWSASDRSLISELHRRGSLRRAVLLREILGQPLGLEFGPPNLPRR